MTRTLEQGLAEAGSEQILPERTALVPAATRPAVPGSGRPAVTMVAALNAALADALADDPRVLVFGEDVGTLGGVFRVTDGLAARFGEDRVFDTPLAEAGIVGTAIGMAMNGLVPVVEMQFDAFAYPAFEQVTSHLAKLRNRTRGRVSLPVVVRIPYGGGIGGVEHHSDASEAYYTHTPGLRVVTPGGPADAYHLLVGYGTRPSPRRPRGLRRRSGYVSQAPAPADAMAAADAAPAPADAMAAADAAPAPTDAMAAADAAPAPVLSAPARARTGPVPVISPIVRRLARQAGLDLARIVGTGPQGLVLRRDVNQAIAARGRSPDEVRIPIRGTRKAAAEKLTRSRREIPEATVWVDADASGLLAARAELAAQAPASLLAVAARFALAGLSRYPELNAHLEGDEIVIPAHVHLGFAAQTERGLVVPVVRNAHLMPARELAAALARQTAAARSGRLIPADLTGGTFTVNNYGVFGVDGSAAIINHPEVAILGLGRIIDRPWVVDGQLAVRKVTELTLAFDHRVCDGATAGGFLRYVADRVESPALALETLSN